MRTTRPINGYIRDAIDTTGPRVGDYSLRAHADDAPAPVCKCGKPKPKRADAKPLSKERALTDALRERMARQYITPGDAE